MTEGPASKADLPGLFVLLNYLGGYRLVAEARIYAARLKLREELPR